MSYFRIFGRALAACLFCVSLIRAGAPASVTGRVTDGQAGVPGVTVTLRGAAPRVERKAITSETGEYCFDSLAPGSYELDFARQGFDVVRRATRLGEADERVDVVLKPAMVATTVDVTDVAGKATASRMEIPDRELPAMVSSVPAETLEEQAANDLPTALQNVSSMSARVQYGVYEYYSFRGFASSEVMLVDGMRLEGNRINTQLNNVEQVDVLKGPSSVLYGAEALSGAINIVRKKPQAQRAYDFTYRTGRFGLQQYGGGATGNVFNSEHLLYRVDTMLEDKNGWRGAGGRRFNVSPTLTWLLGSRLRVTLFQGLTRDHYDLDAGIPTALYLTPGFDLGTRFNTVQDFERAREWQNQVFVNAQLTSRLEFRNSFFMNRKGDQYYNAESLSYSAALTQVNRTALYFYHHRRPVQNQSDLLGRYRFLGVDHYFLTGYEYQDNYTASDRAASRSVALAPVLLPSLSDAYVPVPDFPLSSIDKSSVGTKAIYWQDQISVTQRLKLSVGGRYSDYDRRSHTDTYTNGVASRGADTIRQTNAYTYRAGAVYGLTERQQLYFASNTSFKPLTTVSADGRILEPERGQSYEIGHRWQTMRGRLKINTAAYKMMRQNVAISLGSGLYDQAGQQSSKGIDFDANGDLGHGIRVVAAYGYTLPRYDNYFTSNGTVSMIGRRPSYTTRHTGNVWLTKRWNSGIYASVGSRYMGPVFLNDANTLWLGGWAKFSGAFGVHKRAWDWSVNADNLLNRQHYVTATLSSGNQVYPGSPITVQATIRYRFR
jgi:outer membrane receptor protein involved in Fe transport